MTYEELYDRSERRVQRLILKEYLFPIYRQIRTIVKNQGISAAYYQVENITNRNIVTNLLATIYEREGERFYIYQNRQFEKIKSQKLQTSIGFFSVIWKRIMQQVLGSTDLLIRIVQINETTKKDLRRILRLADSAGLGAEETARQISKQGLYLRARALRIARTETTYAASLGMEQSAKESTLPLVKKWVSARDARTREDHINANGQIVVKDGMFKVGGKQMKYPGDPRGGVAQVVNCRCSVVYLVKED